MNDLRCKCIVGGELARSTWLLLHTERVNECLVHIAKTEVEEKIAERYLHTVHDATCNRVIR